MSKKTPKKGKASLTLIKNVNYYKETFYQEKRSSQIDLKKVNRIRKAIQTGQYQIDFERLADKLLSDKALKD